MTDYTNQEGIFNPELQKSQIIVVGAGSTGSFITLNLAKLGFNNIGVIDFDKVEEHNIPNQFYRHTDVDVLKVKALQDIVLDFTNNAIVIDERKIDENYEFDVNMNSIVVICVDNMETRKLIFEKLKDLPVKVVDTRMGGEGYQIYAYDMSCEEDVERFRKNLDGEVMETVCGQKSVIYTILSLASEVCQIVKQLDKDEENFKIIKREMRSLRILGK